MNKDVRISRQERKRQDKLARRPAKPAASKKEKKKKKKKMERKNVKGPTYAQHKKLSRARIAEFAGFEFLVDLLGLKEHTDLSRTIDEIIQNVRHGGVREADYARAIFDPERTSLSDLPIGLLDHKEETLPHDFVPTGDNIREELDTHCRRMIIRSQSETVVELVAKGWPGSDLPEIKFERHIGDLVRLSRADHDLYVALVAGQHGCVIRALRHDRVPAGFTREMLVKMLVIHGLIWCCNDVQLVMARCYQANTNPMMKLIESDKLTLQPSTVSGVLAPMLEALKLIQSIYAHGDVGGDQIDLPEGLDSDKIESLRKTILASATAQDIDLSALKPGIDRMMLDIERRMQRKGALREQMEAKPAERDQTKEFNRRWFGLSTAQAAAVPIVRYVQAEQQLEGEIRYLIGDIPDGRNRRASMALDAFPEGSFRHRWKSRAMQLYHVYRQRILLDPYNCSTTGRGDPNKNTGDEPLTEAKAFLQKRGERFIGDTRQTRGSKERAFYLLDVIPEHRLAL